MSEAQIYETLTGIFIDLFDDESIVLTAGTTAADVPGWDSFSHNQLIVAVEAAFGVRIGAGEIESLKSVGDLVLLIQKKHKR